MMDVVSSPISVVDFVFSPLVSTEKPEIREIYFVKFCSNPTAILNPLRGDFFAERESVAVVEEIFKHSY